MSFSAFVRRCRLHRKKRQRAVGTIIVRGGGQDADSWNTASFPPSRATKQAGLLTSLSIAFAMAHRQEPRKSCLTSRDDHSGTPVLRGAGAEVREQSAR